MIKFRKAGLGALWALLFLLGLAGGYLAANSLQALTLAGFAREAAERASAFAPSELARLSGTAADAGEAPYAAVKERLMRLQALDADARLVFLLRFRPATGRIHFLADSTPSGAKPRFAPGEEARDAAASPGLKRAMFGGAPSADGPSADAEGDPVVVAYAPIRETTIGRAGTPTNDALAVEFVPADLARRWWIRALQGALLIWFVLGVPLAFVRISGRHREQRGALRNLLAAMEQSSSAVMIVNLDSRIEYANAGLCQQMGYGRRELIGRSWRDFQQAETPPELLAELVANVRAGRPWSGEWYNRRKTGELFLVHGTITPIKNRQSRISGFVAVFEDMTEARRNESTLRTALDRAEAGDRTKSRFLATMSHEVRTPLNGIVGFTGLLLDTTLTPEQAEYVQTIRTSGAALIQLTSDILDFARIEAGSLKLELQPANPRACVEDTLDLLAVQAADKGLELLHWTDESVPAVVMVDDARLRQVLVNLINNAVKFTEKGRVEVTLEAEAVAGPGAGGEAVPEWRLKFVVRDTGIGIAAEHGAMLFKPFRQVDESVTRRHGGTGLGLAISKNLVELMGGTISFESAPGHGSAFTFTVPVAGVPGMTRTAPDLGRLRVALVAPAGPFRDEFVRLAERWGVALVSAGTLEELAPDGWDVAFVALDSVLARSLAGRPAPPLPRDRAYALVPVSLPSDLRVALRTHFCQLINKPLHHDSLLSLLAGFRPAVPVRTPTKDFGLNVLAVEDNLVNQRLVQKLLHNLGCRVTIAGNGRIALEELARPEAGYDLVLRDLHMPELDGLGAIERIRAGGAGAAVRAIWIAVLTADARAAQKERVVAAGANDYLVKPVSLTELASSLQRYLERA